MLLNDKLLKISCGNSRKATRWVTQELTWSAFIEKLSRPVKTIETFAQYKSLTKAKQDELKDVGGFVGGILKDGRRKNENVDRRYLITLDADNIEPGGTQKIINTVDSLGCAYVVYSTRKHEGASPRLRIIFPLDMDCSADEYEPIARKIASFISMPIFDPTTFEPVRLMYWPSISSDSEFVFLYKDKPFLSREGMLSTYQDWHNIKEWPEVPGAVKIRDRSAKKQGDPLEKSGVVGAFCKSYSLTEAMDEFLPGTYDPCADDGRFTYTGGSTVGGAVLYDDKFLYSHHATDPCSGKLCNAFDLVRLHLFGEEDAEALPETPVNNLPSFKAMCAFALTQKSVSDLLVKERYDAANQEFGNSLPMQAENYDWLSKLQIHAQTGKPLSTINNVQLIIENDPRLSGKVYHDDYLDRPMACAPLPWEAAEYPYKPRMWSETDDAGLRSYIEFTYGITGKEKVMDGFSLYALNHRKNYLKDFLLNIQWDGIQRVDTLLIDYFGAEDTIFTREAMRKWLMAAVTRVLHPGVKFDNMLILAGRQGVGKSTFFRILGIGWYSDSLYTFEGKDAAELLKGYWIIEAGELTGMTKSEMNAVKAFLSKCEDVYRAPYGRRTENYPRRCVIAGTTNESEFLKDYTGNRRFWPVDLEAQPSTKSVFRDLANEVYQIWAEVMYIYRTGESLVMSLGAEKLAEKAQEEHKESSYAEGMILEFLDKKVPKDWYSRSVYKRLEYLRNEFDRANEDENTLMLRDRICAAEIWTECYMMPSVNRMKKSDAKEINSILENMEDWERQKSAARFGGEYGSQRGYTRKQCTIFL